MNKNKEELRSNVITGFSTLVVREFFLKLFSFFGQVLLARLLFPSDFGVYVVIVFIVSIFALFSDIGLSNAIIQKTHPPTKKELSAVFWTKIILSLILIVLIWICTPLIHIVYPSLNKDQFTMLWIFSSTLLLTGLRVVPVALLERNIKYHLISVIDVVGVVVYYLVAILLAYFHFGVWSFIIGVIIKEILEVIVLYWFQPFFPSLHFAWKSIKKLVHYGIYIQGNTVVMFFIGSIIPGLGGRFTSSASVGLLDFANSLVAIPNVISMNFSRVAFAGFSRIQTHKKLLSKSIDKSVSMLAIILFIFPVLFIAFGKDLILFLYTEKWIAAYPALFWFSLSIFLYPQITSWGQVILSVGRSKEIFRSTLFVAITGWTLGYFFIKTFGFVGISIANLFIYFGLFSIYFLILRKTNIHFSLLKVTFPKLIAAFATLGAGILLNMFLPTGLIFLLLEIILISILYIVLMFLLARNDTNELFAIVRERIKKGF